MRVTDFKKEGSDGRLIITGMIVSSRVLGAVATKWSSDGLFDSDYLDRIGNWCVKHYNKFGKAPGTAILNYHRRWSATRNKSSDEEVAIDRLLSSLSEEYVKRERKTIQADYVIQVATDLFTAVAAKRAAEEAKDLIAAGKPHQAVEVLNKVGKVDMTDEEMTSVLEDESAVKTAFEEGSEPLVIYPDAAGNFFKNRLKRRAFVAFEGPEKKGKSFWILDVAWRAMQQKRKVAYFEVGDMPKEDVIKRLASRAAGKPVDPSELDEGGVYHVPISIQASLEMERPEVILQDRKIDKMMEWTEARDAFKRKVDKYGRDLLKLSCHPTNTVSVNGIIQKLERQKSLFGWVPDVVCVDYADILAPINGTANSRDQINLTWAMLRSLAMSWNCLVVTATQASRSAYNAEIIEMEHTSEDKRKLSHVTMLVGINQTDEEKDMGIYRLNLPVARHGKYNKRKCLTTAGCLAIASPCMRSVF